MSNTKCEGPNLGDKVLFYLTKYDPQFRRDFDARPVHRFPLGPYAATVADVNMDGTVVSVEVLGASGKPFWRSGVRVLGKGVDIPAHAEFDCCALDMSRARILRDPDAVWESQADQKVIA